MKLQGKKTGAFAGFIGYLSPSNPTVIDLPSGESMLTVRYRYAGAICFKDYKTVAEFNADWEDYASDESTEPDPGYTVVKIQKLENSVKELNVNIEAQRARLSHICRRLDAFEKILKVSGVGFCPIHNQDKPCKDCIGKIIEQIKEKEEEE